MGSTYWLIVLTILIAQYIALFFYIRTMKSVEDAVNQRGGNATYLSAWWLLVPIVNVALYFAMLMKLRDAIDYADLKPKNRIWFSFGLIAGGLYLVSIFLSQAGSAVSTAITIGWLIFGIVHWRELGRLRAELLTDMAQKPSDASASFTPS